MNQKSQTSNLQEENFTLEDLREMTVQKLERNIRKNTIEYIGQIMQEEVKLLCGKVFQHKNGKLAHRGGNDTGSIILNGNRVAITKPRVRKDGKEIQLQSYSKLHLMENIIEIVFKMMISGTSTRSYNDVTANFEDELGISKSTVSRQFIKKSREYLSELNSRKFPDKTFWAIMIDGIHIGGDVIVVVLGVDTDGNKHFLGVSQGSTENAIVVTECLNRLTQRGIKFTDRVVAVLDGAKALHKAVNEYFGKNVEIQRCLNHKMKNVEAKLSKKYHDDFRIRIRQAYGLNSYLEAKDEFQNIVSWLSAISYNASESLTEGLENILTLHRIEMPPELRKSFYTSNLIESGFSSPRFRMNRIKKWIKQGDMIKRWAGATLLYQEKKFRKVKRYDAIESFLNEYSDKSKKEVDSSQVA